MIYWNPDPVAFTIPFLDIPIFIYGLCFVIGFVLAYWLLVKMLDRRLKEVGIEDIKTTGLVDQMAWFVVGGTIIGARLGHVFFYDWPYFREHPIEIFKVWHGGLASHGGFIGSKIIRCM